MNHTYEELVTPSELDNPDVTSLVRPTPIIDAIHLSATRAAQEGFEPAVAINAEGQRVVFDRARF
jgi:hypothetical protein